MNTYSVKKSYLQSNRNNVKLQALLICFFTAFFSINAQNADWTVLIYMQADGSLQKSAQDALDALVNSCAFYKDSRDRLIRIVVEIHAENACSRYAIDCHGLQLYALGQLLDSRSKNQNPHNGCACSCVYSPRQQEFNELVLGEKNQRNNSLYDSLMNACRWAYERYPSKHTMLILSGHGSGILEPLWNERKQCWVYEPDEGDSYYTRWRAQQNYHFLETVNVLCDHKALFLKSSKQNTFNSLWLTALLSRVSESVLRGKKIDIVGFDACHMGMFEIAYALRDYARFMIASQDCEEKEGWDYRSLVTALQEKTARMCARKIVYAHENNQRRQQRTFFSLSALELSCVAKVAAAFDTAVDDIVDCLAMYKKEFHDILCVTRQKNQRLCLMPMYADFISFFENLLTELPSLESTPALERLQVSLLDVLQMSKEMVVAHVAGSSCPGARGCSFYFPLAHIDSSYILTTFALNSRWLKLLEAHLL